MAGHGPAPSGNRSRERDNKVRTTIVADGKMRGFDLPQLWRVDEDGKKRRVAWGARTTAWWSHWRNSPQSTHLLTNPDWDFLLDTALLHRALWVDGRLEVAAELRLRLQQFGATPEARARIGVEIGSAMPGSDNGPASTEPPRGAAGKVSSIDDERRKRLVGA